jgi:hypothetical protein
MGLLLQLGSRVVRPVDCELIQSRVDAYAEGLVHRRRCRCWDLNCVRVGEMIPIAILMLDVCDVSAPRGSYKSHLIERRRSGKSWIELPFLPLQVAGKNFAGNISSCCVVLAHRKAVAGEIGLPIKLDSV